METNNAQNFSLNDFLDKFKTSLVKKYSENSCVAYSELYTLCAALFSLKKCECRRFLKNVNQRYGWKLSKRGLEIPKLRR